MPTPPKVLMSQHARYRRLVFAGKCGKCGRDREIKERSTCNRCLEQSAIRSARRSERRKIAKEVDALPSRL